MCRPLWACWVNGRAYSVLGEGGHIQVTMRYPRRPRMLIKAQNGATICMDGIKIGDLKEPWEARMESTGVNPATMHPFECRWFQEREALWQPNTNRFYKLGETPAKKQFDMAQEQLDKDIGTPDKLRDWVLAGMRAYGDCQLPESAWHLGIPEIQENTEPLFHAAIRVVKPKIAARLMFKPSDFSLGELLSKSSSIFWVSRGDGPFRSILYHREPLSVDTIRDHFAKWAEAFSGRKNRIPLWQH